MASKTSFQVKRTSVAGRAPSLEVLEIGELALNMPDRIMYSTDGINVFEIGSKTTNSEVSGTLTVNAVSANGTTGEAGQVLATNGSTTYWATQRQFYTSNTAPVSATAGDEWYEEDTGYFYVFVDGGWVQQSPGNVLIDANVDGGTF